MMLYVETVVLVKMQCRTFKHHRVFFLLACNEFCGCAESGCKSKFDEHFLENDGGDNECAEDNETDVDPVDDHDHDF